MKSNFKKAISIFTALTSFAFILAYNTNINYSYAEENSFVPGNGGGYVHMPYEEEYYKQYENKSDDQSIIQVQNLPSHYDLRDENAVTPVRNQGPEGMCHIFAVLGACESNILKQGFEDDASKLDLSEAQLGYFLYKSQSDPFDPLYGDYLNTPKKGADGGNSLLASAGLATGMGFERESLCQYQNWNSDYSEYSRYGGQYRLKTCESIANASDTASINKIKNWLMESGAVSMAYYSQRSLYYDNGTTYAYYAKGKSYKQDANHAALIVGWDDDYSKENFAPSSQPSKDGAWLVKNSYGDNIFDDGYFWISYEDPSMGSFFKYIVEKASEHDDVYEYDGVGYVTSYSFDAAANIFTADYDSIITDASFYMPSGNPVNTTYNISVYKLNENTQDPTDGHIIGSASGTISNSGYYTVPLENPAELMKGDQFSLVLTMSCKDKNRLVYLPIEENTSLTSTFTLECNANPYESYIYTDGEWLDTSMCEGSHGSMGNVPIKAFAERTNKDEYVPIMLNTALEAARNVEDYNEIISEAVSIGEKALSENAGPIVCKRAAMSIFASLEESGENISYPEYIYDDYDIIYGDSDGDGDLTITDAIDILSVYAGRSALLPQRLCRSQEIAMDIVNDYQINISDAIEVLSLYVKHAAGL